MAAWPSPPLLGYTMPEDSDEACSVTSACLKLSPIATGSFCVVRVCGLSEHGLFDPGSVPAPEPIRQSSRACGLRLAGRDDGAAGVGSEGVGARQCLLTVLYGLVEQVDKVGAGGSGLGDGFVAVCVVGREGMSGRRERGADLGRRRVRRRVVEDQHVGDEAGHLALCVASDPDRVAAVPSARAVDEQVGAGGGVAYLGVFGGLVAGGVLPVPL